MKYAACVEQESGCVLIELGWMDRRDGSKLTRSEKPSGSYSSAIASIGKRS